MKELMRQNRVPEAVQAAFGRAVRCYARREYVTGVDTGYKVRDGKVDIGDKTWYVRVHVREKLPRGHLTRRERIPDDIDGVPTDVIEADYVATEGPPSGPGTQGPNPRVLRQPVLQGGLSIGHRAGGPGTLGAFVTDLDTGARCLVTADHVVAPGGNPGGDAGIYQPGAWDAFPDPANLVATIHRRHALMGVALARMLGNRPEDNQQFETNDVIQGVRWPQRDDVLVKSGRTTGVTRGCVLGFGKYPGCTPGIWLGLVPGADPDTEITMAGDSGAVWYDPMTRKAVGLQARGEDDSLPQQEWALATVLAHASSKLRFYF